LETSADLTIKGPGTFACPIYVTGGTTTIEGGTVSHIDVEKGGALAVKGGTVKGFYGADGWYEDGCISAKDGASVTVTGGTIGGSEKTNAGVYLEYGSSLKMSGGEISGNYYGVSGISDYGENGKKPDSGISTVEISGGKITSNDTGIRNKGWGATAISGGEIKGNNYGVTGGDVVITGGYICDNAEEGASGDDVTMSGGEVTGNRIGFTAYDSQKLKVSGGKITATDSSGSYAISFDDGCLELSGDPVIGSQDGEDGIYLGNDCKVTVAGKFEQGARIALSPGGVLGGDFTRGYSTYNGSGLPSKYFYVQGGGYSVSLNSSTNEAAATESGSSGGGSAGGTEGSGESGGSGGSSGPGGSGGSGGSGESGSSEESGGTGGSEGGTEAVNISGASVTLSPKSYSYDGKAKTPYVAAYYGAKALSQGRDYTVAYRNNVDPGTASVVLTGIGSYTGTKTATFSITGTKESWTLRAPASVTAGKKISVTSSGISAKPSYSSSDSSVASVSSGGTVTGKKAGTAKITAKATVNGSAQTKTLTVKVLPAAPGSVSAKASGASVKVSWSKSAGASGYYVFRNGKKAATVGASAGSYTDKNAPKGKSTSYKVQAYAKTGTSAMSKSASAFLLAAPSAKSAANSAKGAATFKWSKAAGAGGYEIQYSTSSTFKSGNKTKSAKSSASSAKVTGLKKGKTYRFRVRAYRGSGKSKYYSPWSGAKKVKISK
ncbi:MAG: fibronectin type III domain-containing protein, partial [Bacteroidales bacterium]|nr:fibronectin type III domain-containing protein [Bacteroidales bacterium]